LSEANDIALVKAEVAAITASFKGFAENVADRLDDLADAIKETNESAKQPWMQIMTLMFGFTLAGGALSSYVSNLHGSLYEERASHNEQLSIMRGEKDRESLDKLEQWVGSIYRSEAHRHEETVERLAKLEAESRYHEDAWDRLAQSRLKQAHSIESGLSEKWQESMDDLKYQVRQLQISNSKIRTRQDSLDGVLTGAPEVSGPNG
jgi:hypothetical protein